MSRAEPQTEPEPKLTAIPKKPKEFGEDGGNFYKRYDALAGELDDDMVKRLKSQLDSILIFAGLFAGVNSAFLALTLPEMSADPADDTNALLLQLVTGGDSTIRSADDLPSATFTPSRGIIPVNVLLSLGLTIAILVSFFAILGQQWLTCYCKRSGGGPENYRWEQLQRYLGARGYGLEAVLDDILPAVLQSALAIFGIAFVIYLQTLSNAVCYVVAALLTIAAEIVFFMSYFSVADKWCPFKSPLSHFMQFISRDPVKYWLPVLVLSLVGFVFYISVIVAGVAIGVILGLYLAFPLYFTMGRRMLSGGLVDSITEMLPDPDMWRYLWLMPKLHNAFVPLGRPTALLQAAAVGRVLRTSGDFNTLIYTAINIQAMNAKEGAQFLLGSDTTVGFICERLRMCSKLSDTGSDTFVELLLYFDLLELILNEESNDQQLSNWLNGVVQNQSGAEVSTPLVISLVAATTRILNEGIGLTGVPSRSQALQLRFISEKLRNNDLNKVQQRRVVITKRLIGALGWNIQLLPSDRPERGRTSALEFIEKAFRTYTPQSPRHPGNTEIWLLEQALLFSSQSRHQRGWKFVAKSSVGLLRSFDKPASEDPTPSLVSTQDSLKEYRRRCARTLSQCVQAVRSHLVPGEFIQTVSPALEELVDYWDRFKDDFTQNPDLSHSEMLLSWFEIRGALDKPGESGWGPLNQQLFGEAYPSLKIGFDAIAFAMSKNALRVDQDTKEQPCDAAVDEQAGRTEPDEAVADPNTPKPDEHSDNPRQGLGESREHEGAREPDSGERNEEPDKQAGHADSTPMNEDE
ncbi:hypothetical protein FS837_009202 [Tulasnella sp. UAMH 9824]|nr:hypothetical protein FS837_009202 [Tulasnella sp. UAMH 9824]